MSVYFFPRIFGGSCIFYTLTFFTCVTVHVGLQGGRTGKSFIADFALVFLLRVGWDFRAELAHH